MNRKQLEQEMSKIPAGGQSQRSVNQTFENQAKNESEPVYTHTAFSIIRDDKLGWCVAEIRFNGAGEMSKLVKIPAGDDRSLAVERFKIRSAEVVFNV